MICINNDIRNDPCCYCTRNPLLPTKHQPRFGTVNVHRLTFHRESTLFSVWRLLFLWVCRMYSLICMWKPDQYITLSQTFLGTPHSPRPLQTRLGDQRECQRYYWTVRCAWTHLAPLHWQQGCHLRCHHCWSLHLHCCCCFHCSRHYHLPCHHLHLHHVWHFRTIPAACMHPFF